MICAGCAFDTDRLLVREWHAVQPRDWQSQDLARFVTELMTEPVTRALPPDWQGEYTRQRALDWIRDRDAEGSTLLVVDRASDLAIGLVILFEANRGRLGVELRIGYLLAESAWRQGYASELIIGFVRWAREQAPIRAVTAGVEHGNAASVRVLEKAGFRRLGLERAEAVSEQTFEIRLHPG